MLNRIKCILVRNDAITTELNPNPELALLKASDRSSHQAPRGKVRPCAGLCDKIKAGMKVVRPMSCRGGRKAYSQLKMANAPAEER